MKSWKLSLRKVSPSFPPKKYAEIAKIYNINESLWSYEEGRWICAGFAATSQTTKSYKYNA